MLYVVILPQRASAVWASGAGIHLSRNLGVGVLSCPLIRLRAVREESTPPSFAKHNSAVQLRRPFPPGCLHSGKAAAQGLTARTC